MTHCNADIKKLSKHLMKSGKGTQKRKGGRELITYFLSDCLTPHECIILK